MAGRPPKPTALKLLTGNPGKRPLPHGEPVPPPGKAQPPDWMSTESRKLWDHYAPRFEAMGTLTVADEAAFATWMTILAKIALSERSGIPVSNETAGRSLAYATAFGGTGSGRARLGTNKPEEPGDALDKYLSGAKRG